MRRRKTACIILLLFLVSPLTALPAKAEESVMQALKNGAPLLDLNYRYEFSDDGLRPERGEASTLRIRLGYKTGEFKGFSTMLELESTNELGSDNYDAFSGANPNNDKPDNPQYAVIADPLISELNQAYIQYSGDAKTRIRFGRQRFILPTARFVGNVGWRQNEQTYDAFTVQTNVLNDLTITYGYLYGRQDVLGVGETMDTHLFDAAYAGFSPLGTITAYAYLLDLDRTPDSKTFGLRLGGKQILDEYMLLYKAEYAYQSEYADALDFSAPYLAGEFGASYRNVLGKIGYELMGAGNGISSGFSTPLATLHIFNGWADRFLSTPAAGLEDRYGELSISVRGVKLSAIYHDFSSDKGDVDFGNEIDLQVIATFDKFAIGAKLADYHADHPEKTGPENRDVTKVWFWMNYTL